MRIERSSVDPDVYMAVYEGSPNEQQLGSLRAHELAQQRLVSTAHAAGTLVMRHQYPVLPRRTRGNNVPRVRF